MRISGNFQKNKFFPIVLVLLVFISLSTGCVKDEAPQTVPDPYSFFVAGHTYGNHLAENIHLHPPFVDQFAFIRDYPDMTLGFLTGDIVRESNTESWNAVDEDVESLGFPVYFAPGNHDVTNRELFESRYGDPLNSFRSFRSFNLQKDLFIVLDSELDEWNISNEQLTFLQSVLNNIDEETTHIFVFIHALIWWDDENIFKNIHTNWWPPYIPDTTNYWIDVEPLLQMASAPVCIFAGDLGANEQASPFMFYHDLNITYIGTGMGNLTDDNYLFINVSSDGKLNFELIAMQGDKYRFGKIEDYILP